MSCGKIVCVNNQVKLNTKFQYCRQQIFIETCQHKNQRDDDSRSSSCRMSNFPKRSVTSTRLVFCTVTGRLGATATSCLCSSSSTSPASVPTSAWWCNISASHQQQRHVFCSFHWAQKLVSTSFPVGNIVPLKLEVVFPSGILGILRAPWLPTKWRLPCNWTICVFYVK